MFIVPCLRDPVLNLSALPWIAPQGLPPVYLSFTLSPVTLHCSLSSSHAGYTLCPLNRPSQSVLIPGPLPGMFFYQIFAWLLPSQHLGLYSNVISSESSVTISSKVTALISIPPACISISSLLISIYAPYSLSSCAPFRMENIGSRRTGG